MVRRESERLRTYLRYRLRKALLCRLHRRPTDVINDLGLMATAETRSISDDCFNMATLDEGIGEGGGGGVLSPNARSHQEMRACLGPRKYEKPDI